MNITRSVIFGVLVLSNGTTLAQRPEIDEFKCFFGALHSHCVLSPDFQPGINRNKLKQLLEDDDPDLFELANGPIAAWTRAATHAKVDFLALTEHKHGPEGNSGEPCPHEMPPGGYRFLVKAADRINSDPDFAGKFLAIPAMEWSSIGKGNHVNIMFAKHAVPDAIPSGDFRRLIHDYLANGDFEKNNPRLLVQMNHPNANGGSFSKNYGRNEFPNGAAGTIAFSKEFRPFYSCIEHINNSDLGNANEEEANAHRDGNLLDQFYRRYLNIGLRLAPTAGHDNHRATWGRHTAARTGVWMKELTADGFVNAMKARRVFATEDNELAVALRSGDHWMGSEVAIPADGELRTFTVDIDQMADTDTGDVQNEGLYTVRLIGDEDGPGGNRAGVVDVKIANQWRESVFVRQGESVFFQRFVRPGNYYYVQVTEQHGVDAEGNNGDAWTAPIWFENEE